MTPQSPLLKALFSSALRVKILGHLFLHPGERAHLRGLASLLQEPAGTVRRELLRLAAAGIVESRAVGNQRQFTLNETLPIRDELRAIFTKLCGGGAAIQAALDPLPGIELVFIYGSFAGGKARAGSDMDVMIVGDASHQVIAPAIAGVERRQIREINYTLYARSEVRRRLGTKGDFVHEVFAGPRILLIGSPDDRLFQAD